VLKTLSGAELRRSWRTPMPWLEQKSSLDCSAQQSGNGLVRRRQLRIVRRGLANNSFTSRTLSWNELMISSYRDHFTVVTQRVNPPGSVAAFFHPPCRAFCWLTSPLSPLLNLWKMIVSIL
jgi:hypothetical protein